MKKKNKIVLFGAYDRYNYGDNLMPIVITDYINKYKPEALVNNDILYVSISKSNLTKYGAPATTPINEIYDSLSNNDSIIVCGGEVLCAKLSTLYLHMPKPQILNKLLIKLNSMKYVNRLVDILAKFAYPSPWSFPYIPNKNKMKDRVSIYYNTIGGDLGSLNEKQLSDIKNRLVSAKYISARDVRTKSSLELNNIGDVNLIPDSVGLISKLYDQEYLTTKISNKVGLYINKRYICFQAAPNKLGEPIDVIVKTLNAICTQNGYELLLLPIGYACGHDDFEVLNEIHELLPNISSIEYELNLWEIMYLIKNSEMYIGTSLHGAITALSYGVPHFGLNKKISKLDNFLKSWSVYPFNGCYSISEIENKLPNITSESRQNLKEKSEENCKHILSHFNFMINQILEDGNE
jgi:polysaccharide pyruvyl transferase WcaK-like protein